MQKNPNQNANIQKTFRLYTLGCKVNSYETQAIREYFLSNGFAEVKKGSADYVVVNTCTVTKSADDKSLYAVRSAKKNNPYALVIALGCLAEKDANLLEKAGADKIIPHSRKQEIFSVLKDGVINLPAGRQGVAPAAEQRNDIWDFKVTNTTLARAFLKIQDGCDNKCSFCKVNIVRGKSKSRPVQSIVEEFISLINIGKREIVLCGTNLASWSGDGVSFVDLLKQLVMLEGRFRIRLGSVEAPYVTEELVALIAGSPKLAQHIHIPFQSGSDAVLRYMNKKVNKLYYFDIIDLIRRYMPCAGISCDIMVGFPGESDVDFQDTLDLLNKAQPVKTHVFTYSPRSGTEAYCLDVIAPDILIARVNAAEKSADKLAEKFKKTCFLGEEDVIFDARISSGSAFGYTGNYIRIEKNRKKIKKY